MVTVNHSSIPQRPGVYFFRNRRNRILYIGKAANLRARIRSYFAARAALPPAKRALLEEAKRITWEEAPNDIAALIREAELIKTHRPKYNVLLRDDKNYFFVGFTRETFPRVFLTHQPSLADSKWQIADSKTAKKPYAMSHKLLAVYIGPFTDGGAIKQTLRLLRRIFPYATHQGFPKRCLEYDLGLCPLPPSSGDMEYGIRDKALVRVYAKNITAVREVLAGKRTALLKRLEREMREAATRGDFTTAARRRDEMRGLERVFSHRTVLSAQKEHRLTAQKIPQPIRNLLRRNDRGRTPIMRIEGYDIANLAYGKYATGAMTVFTDGRPEPASYRQFRIRSVRGANDVKMLSEVLTRRLRHPEWPLPDLMLIDGGKAQLNAALTAYSEWQIANSKAKLRKLYTIRHMPFAIVSLAKRDEELYLPNKTHPLRLPKNDPFLHLLMHVRDETHRFARRYHHRLLDKEISK